ncbi:threonyl-tRNA synthetase [Naganishia friedmannii]|uniref:Threonyl-tRNA synthetase n=1 Tax=Naganishia friedmannii TaxID=89922 RepID=A0ACC2VRD5_9TREE|nr:threonyl-tRNA synthetase [Naganishia friedmannii]
MLVNGELWDLHRPLEASCSLALLDFDSPDNDYEARQVFWHSSAHVLGEACEKCMEDCRLGYGPPQESGGFFYEMRLKDNRPITPADFPGLEASFKKAVKEKQPFERLELPKEALLEMFAYNSYKQHYIQNQVPDGTSSTVYRCGPLIDFCRGPHVPHTGRIKAMAITKNSSSYFLADAKNDTLQRLYGISFPDSKQLTEYKKFIEEAEKRDHRRIGKQQELFMFHELSPGSAFFLPMGQRIYNTLTQFIRSEYHKRGYQEVGSPNMFNSKLWETSGHWQNYADDMFQLDVDKEKFAIKPMNCPGHCLIFDARERSYKELPLRMAEFGVLHRNEASGALSGLTRVRRFVQDDAHIFCTPDQIEDEIAGVFDLLETVYGALGFTYKVGLSTRNPDKFIGDLAVWDKAEDQLKRVLERVFPGQWKLNEGDGAFYGPKIDIAISDALKREFQCATIQLDFNLPERFKLQYRAPSKEGETDLHRPVMIHRAILGSIERFIGILTEHCAGNWPFWVSPRQVIVVPVAAAYNEYASAVAKKLWDVGIFSETDLTGDTLKKKILNAEISRWNFILVVGEDELRDQSVNCRSRDDEKKGRSATLPLDDFVRKCLALKESRGGVSSTTVLEDL